MSARPYQPVSFEAFRVSGRHTARIAIGECDNLPKAVIAAQPACLHKEQLAIVETGEGVNRLHLYAIRQKPPQWVRLASDHYSQRVRELWADPVCVIDLNAIQQVEKARAA